VPIFSRLASALGNLTVYAEEFAGPVAGATNVRIAGFGVGTTRIHPQVLGEVLRGRYRAVIVQGRLGLATALALVWLAPRSRTRIIWWTPLWRPNGEIAIAGGIQGALTRWILRRVDAVVTYGKRARDVAVAAGIPATKVFVAYNSLDTGLLSAAEREWSLESRRIEEFVRRRGLTGHKVVLFVGRMIARKRIDDLLLAVQLLVQNPVHRALKLVLIGDGPELPRTKARAESLGIGDHVMFQKAIVDVNAICPYFLAARVVVLPGAGGLVVNQAMTHGVPVIVGGGDGTESDSVVDGINGYLWNGESGPSLAQLIERILALSDAEWRVWSDRARTAVAKVANVDSMIDGLVRAVGHEGG
jgi:glycosyltransferase involved in cell wall biosynthesis